MNKVPVYWRRLIVRAIEDALILIMMCAGIWAVGSVMSLAVDWLATL